MAEFVRDTFDGPAFELLENHVPELGGVPINLPAFPGGSMQILNPGSVRPHSLSQTIYQYPAVAPTADVSMSCTITAGVSGITPYIGLLVRGDGPGSNHIIVRFEQPGNFLTYYVIVGGAVSSSGSAAFTLVQGTNYFFQVDVIGNILTASVDGSALISASAAALVTAGQVGYQCATNSLIGTTHLISDVTAWTPEPAPTTQMNALTARAFTFCVYTPATATTLQKITLYTTPQNVIIKGPWADTVWAWLAANTPPDLISGPL